MSSGTRNSVDKGLLLFGANVLDVAALEFRRADVLVRGGVIQKIGNLSRRRSPRRIDARGLYIVPGFIDAHVHLSGTGFHCRLSEMPDPLAMAMVNAKSLLADGVTTIRCAGGWVDGCPVDVNITANASSWRFLAPQMISCGGKTLHSAQLDFEDLPAVREAVRDRQSKGASWIKIMLGPQAKRIGRVLPPILTYIKGRKLRSFCHAQTPQVSQVIRGGVDCLEHTFFLTRHTLRLMQPSQFLVPTLGVSEGEALEPTRLAVKMGVSIGLGSDAGIPDNPVAGALMREMRMFVEGVGLPPLKVIQLATLHNSRLLRLRRTGQIREGYAADMVLLKQDPTTEIEAVADVGMVIAKGHVAVDRLQSHFGSIPHFF